MTLEQAIKTGRRFRLKDPVVSNNHGWKTHHCPSLIELTMALRLGHTWGSVLGVYFVSECSCWSKHAADALFQTYHPFTPDQPALESTHWTVEKTEKELAEITDTILFNAGIRRKYVR